MRFEDTKIFNFENAMIGMREANRNFDNIDTIIYNDESWTGLHTGYPCGDGLSVYIGPNDMRMAQSLDKPDFLNHILVSVKITAPLSWWNKHAFGSTLDLEEISWSPITLDCFEITDFTAIDYPEEKQREDLKYPIDSAFIQMALIPYLEYLRQTYVATQNEVSRKELLRWLPTSWLQTKTITLSYQDILLLCAADGADSQFIKWAYTLPYARELIFYHEILTSHIEETESDLDRLLDDIKRIADKKTISTDKIIQKMGPYVKEFIQQSVCDILDLMLEDEESFGPLN